MSKTNLELALIGNCAIGALIDAEASIVWMCYPRFDGEPVFCSLLKDGTEEPKNGYFNIELIDLQSSEQSYLHNTAIVKTTLTDKDGNGLEILDYAPRFNHFGRTHRPATIIRKIVPFGSPRVRFFVRPAHADGAQSFNVSQGSNHLRFFCEQLSLRLTTNISISAIMDETTVVLGETKYMIFGEDDSVTESLPELCERFLAETETYWLEWCRYLAIPFEWQNEVIRAAITLKLSSFEDTGAIIAAMTTSVPEAANTERNWDYRYCWLRDSFFTVQSLNRLGVTRTMEQYLQYLINIVATMDGDCLQPVYCINGTKEMPERMLDAMQGYRGMGPVRIGNQAAEQIQHDVYGAVILSVRQIFFDERIRRRGDEKLFRLLEKVGEFAVKKYDQPDAGLWELRGQRHVHTFSSMMCWTAADKLAKIAKKLQLSDRREYWQHHADSMKSEINKRGFNKKLNSYTATWGGETLDASLLLAFELGFVEAKSSEFMGTLDAIEKNLKPEGSKYLFRYVTTDDFGEPENAFTICTFWYIDALAAVGRKEEARKLFEELLAQRNNLGLLSEDINPDTGELWGNFPQTYSMVGIINSARTLSESWECAL